MKLWLRTLAILGATILAVLLFDYWRKEPFRRRAAFDGVRVGMTRDEVVAMMGDGGNVHLHKPYKPGGTIVCGLRVSPVGLRSDPFDYDFFFDDRQLLARKSVFDFRHPQH
jgi:hypothetical protein